MGLFLGAHAKFIKFEVDGGGEAASSLSPPIRMYSLDTHSQ